MEVITGFFFLLEDQNRCWFFQVKVATILYFYIKNIFLINLQIQAAKGAFSALDSQVISYALVFLV